MTGFSGSDPRAIEIVRQSLSMSMRVKGSVIDHYLIFWRTGCDRGFRSVALGISDAGHDHEQQCRGPLAS